MLPGCFREFRAAQHACDFFGSIFSGHLADGGAGASGGFFLFNHVVMIAEGGDLRQVGHAQHLIAAGERLELLADRLRGPSANASIDFVKNQSLLSAPSRGSCGQSTVDAF